MTVVAVASSRRTRWLETTATFNSLDYSDILKRTMKEATKTICFVVAASVMLTAAIASNIANRPRPVTDFETIGQPFYPEFVKTDVARSLVVNSLDELSVKRQKFEIKQEDGLWQIPSHEGYPAEAAKRLADTSASLMGITRDSLVGRSVADHVKFGVIDPRGEDITDVDAVGQSITLRDVNDDVLVDLIVGKEATDEGDRTSPGQMMRQDDQTYYYVRREDESNVYRIPLQIDVSTKFADWIEPDLLQIEADKVVAVKLNNYQVEQRGGGLFGGPPTLLKKPGDNIALTRESSTDDWMIEEIDDATETLKKDEVSSIVGVLDDMAIVDVKRKPTLDGQMLLDADLNYSLTPEQAKLMSVRTQQQMDQLTNEQQLEFQSLQIAISELQKDLQTRGFNFGSTGEELELVSAGGEVQAATSDGLLYTLHVGKANASNKKEIKVAGASDDTDEEKTEDDENAAGDDTEPRDPSSAEDKESDSKEESSDNRYVLIRVGFDESYIGAELTAPEEPVSPVKPEGYVPEPEKDESKDAADEESAEGDDDAAPKPKAAERDEKFAAYDVAMAAYEEEKIDFEVAMSEFKTEQEERASQIKLGKQKAKILNERFEDWYYVVSGENLATLQADRKALIEVKEPPKTPLDGLGKMPDTSFPNIDVGADATAATGDPEMKVEKPSTEKPPTEKPPTKKPDTKPPTEKPETPKTEEPKADKVEAETPETKVEPPADSEVEVKDLKTDSDAPAASEQADEPESSQP